VKKLTTSLAVGVVAIATVASGPLANAATTGTTITVHTGTTLATVPSAAIGVNDWQADEYMNTPGSDSLLAADGVRVRELNTGPWDDVYRWQTNSFDHDPITDGYGPATAQPWQTWASHAKRIGAQMMVHVNYGSTATDGPGGTDIGPQEAAAWVRQANIVDHDGIKYWAIGEEVWGNGYFSFMGDFEPDHHTDKGPTFYGQEVAKYAAAMKAVDPSIKIGVELTPFGSTLPGGLTLPPWNDPVLAAAGNAVDFVDVHSYNYGGDDAALLASTANIPSLMQLLRGEIAKHVQVVIGETNSNGIDPGTQGITTPDALFAPDDILTWLEQGASDVNWFDSRHGPFPDQAGSPDDPNGTGYATWGLLSDGPTACIPNTAGQQVCEPPLNTPYPGYYGYGMATRLATPGARLVSTTGAAAPIVTHAAIQRDGKLVVLVENEDPQSAHDVTIDYDGYRPQPFAPAFTYGPRGPGVTVTRSGNVHLAPYSMTELVLSRG
jgi:hypothetical protein